MTPNEMNDAHSTKWADSFFFAMLLLLSLLLHVFSVRFHSRITYVSLCWKNAVFLAVFGLAIHILYIYKITYTYILWMLTTIFVHRIFWCFFFSVCSVRFTCAFFPHPLSSHLKTMLFLYRRLLFYFSRHRFEAYILFGWLCYGPFSM